MAACQQSGLQRVLAERPSSALGTFPPDSRGDSAAPLPVAIGRLPVEKGSFEPLQVFDRSHAWTPIDAVQVAEIVAEADGFVAIDTLQRIFERGGQLRFPGKRELHVEEHTGAARQATGSGAVRADAAVGPHRAACFLDESLHEYEGGFFANVAARLMALSDEAVSSAEQGGTRLVDVRALDEHAPAGASVSHRHFEGCSVVSGDDEKRDRRGKRRDQVLRDGAVEAYFHTKRAASEFRKPGDCGLRYLEVARFFEVEDTRGTSAAGGNRNGNVRPTRKIRGYDVECAARSDNTHRSRFRS